MAEPKPLVGYLVKNALGIEAIRILNDRFRGTGLEISFEIIDLAYRDGQVIPDMHVYRRGAIGPIVKEMVPDIELLSPMTSEQAIRNGNLPKLSMTDNLPSNLTARKHDDTKEWSSGGHSYPSEDLGVVVYSLSRNPLTRIMSNSYPDDKNARHLVEQARAHGIKVEFPMIFYNLITVKDDKYLWGLRLDLGEHSGAYHTPVLRQGSGYFDHDDRKLAPTGLPSKVFQEPRGRKLYTDKRGLRILVREGDLSLRADDRLETPRSTYGRSARTLDNVISFVKSAKNPRDEASLADSVARGIVTVRM